MVPARPVLALLLLLSSSSFAGEQRVFVTNEYFTFGSADYFTVAIRLADFDHDGDLDALMVNGRHWARSDLLYSNNGAGRFLVARPLGEAATGYAPTISDLDGDGNLDIVVANDGGPNSIYFNAGSTFERLALPDDPAARSYDVSIGDLNGDGYPDLVFANSESMSRVYLNTTSEQAESLLKR